MRTVVIFVVLLALFAGIKAQAQTPTIKNVPTVPIRYNILPPAEFDHDYDGDLTIKTVATYEELSTLCKISDPRLLACALLVPQLKSCIIILVDDEVMRKREWTRACCYDTREATVTDGRKTTLVSAR